MSHNRKKIKLDHAWLNVLCEEFEKDYMNNLKNRLLDSLAEGKIIYPPKKLIFNAFNMTHFQNVKVIILGQDPYHEPNQAHGLSFSVPDGVPVPPSLLNIYKEIESDLEIEVQKNSGNLERWSKQGVMLLNTTLTVERSKPMSHKDFGWSLFTDKVIHILSENKKNLVFFLWGSHAKSKINLIDTHKHLVIESSHPSPLSVYRGFLGSRPFSKANNYLVENKLKAIDWA